MVVGNIKPEILQEMADDADGKTLCSQLAHIYHYYLHGQRGSRPSPRSQGNHTPDMRKECGEEDGSEAHSEGNRPQVT